MKTFLNLAFLLLPVLLAAQDLPTPIVGQLFAQPGIQNGSPGRGLSIEYERQPRFKLEGGGWGEQENGTNEVEAKERFEAKAKIPFLLKDNWKVLGDVFYAFERYRFEGIEPASAYAFGPLDDAMLRRARLTGYLFRSLSDRTYLTIRAEVSSNGKYDKFVDLSSRYMVYRLAGGIGIKRNEDNEIAFGAMLTDNFGRYTVLPFLIYNHNFNERWGTENLVPIRLKLRHNLNENNIISFAAEYWSSAYSLDVQPPSEAAPRDYIFKNASEQLFVEWETNKLSEWTWLAFRAGYSYNFDSKFIEPGTRNGGRIDAFPSSSVFMSATFFVAPPKDYLERNGSGTGK